MFATKWKPQHKCKKLIRVDIYSTSQRKGLLILRFLERLIQVNVPKHTGLHPIEDMIQEPTRIAGDHRIISAIQFLNTPEEAWLLLMPDSTAESSAHSMPAI